MTTSECLKGRQGNKLAFVCFIFLGQKVSCQSDWHCILMHVSYNAYDASSSSSFLWNKANDAYNSKLHAANFFFFNNKYFIYKKKQKIYS